MAVTKQRPDINGDSSSRLNDYLNDKLQTSADFETLDSLLEIIKSQQELLRRQLADARRDLACADDDSLKQDGVVHELIQGYEKQVLDIDRRLHKLTQSQTSDEAVRRFDASMDKLDRLEIANGYLNILADADKLSAESMGVLSSQPEDALRLYAQLRTLLLNLETLQEKAEGAAPHLIDHVHQVVQDLRQMIKESLASDLTAVLDKILWPKQGIIVPVEVQKQLRGACRNLLALQRSELFVEGSRTPAHTQDDNPSVLILLEILVRPLEVRFRYHFYGARHTNRLDKPEYFMSCALEFLNTYSSFILDYVQPVLVEFAQGTDLGFQPAYIDGSSAFITAILPMLRAKIFSLVPQLLTQPSLLSHLIHELMGFDKTIREEWRYAVHGLSSSSVWKGLTWEVLTREDWFGRWLQVEKEFALARYDSIVNDSDSSVLDYDSLDEKATKPTKAAIRVKDLLETITERYRPLSSFNQKLRFLIDVQISILDRFHTRLNASLEAFSSIATSGGRTVNGVSESDLAAAQGLDGLDRLCRIFGSADYLERAMHDWSDDIFFLELWSDLQDRVKTSSMKHDDPSQSGKPTLVAGQMSILDVASRTSSKLTDGADKYGSDDESTMGALFEETAGAYDRLRARSEKALVDMLSSGLRESLRPYARSNPWSSLSSPAASTWPVPTDRTNEQLTSSLDLSPVLHNLSSNLSFLARTLARLPLRRIARQVMQSLDNYIFDRVIMGNTFSMLAAKQIAVDVETLVAIADRSIGGGLGHNGLRRCLEARTLLNLQTTDFDGNSAAEAEGVVLGDEATANHNADGLRLSLLRNHLLVGNQSARTVLDVLGLEALTENDVREILRRRIELRT